MEEGLEWDAETGTRKCGSARIVGQTKEQGYRHKEMQGILREEDKDTKMAWGWKDGAMGI